MGGDEDAWTTIALCVKYSQVLALVCRSLAALIGVVRVYMKSYIINDTQAAVCLSQ